MRRGRFLSFRGGNKTSNSPVGAVERGPLGAARLAGAGDLLGGGLLGLGDDLKERRGKDTETGRRERRG